MDQQKASYDAGVVKGQTQEKVTTLMDKAGGVAQSAKETVMNAGQMFQPKDNSQKASYDAGVVKGQTQEKASTLMEKAGGAAQTAQKSVMNAGQTVQQTAVGAVDAVKNATGMNK